MKVKQMLSRLLSEIRQWSAGFMLHMGVDDDV